MATVAYLPHTSPPPMSTTRRLSLSSRRTGSNCLTRWTSLCSTVESCSPGSLYNHVHQRTGLLCLACPHSLLEPRSLHQNNQASSVRSLSPTLLTVLPAMVFGSPGISDLSTILEAENSGISRHLPDLDDSKDCASARTAKSPNASRGFNNSTQDVSALDLSTSSLHQEVLAALSQSGPRAGWIDGVVVEDVADSRAPSATEGAHPDVSFNLASVDPDLAALLSPHHIKGTEPALLVAIDAVSSPLRSPTLADTRPNSPASPAHLLPDSRTPPSSSRSASLPRPSSSSRPSLDRSASASKLPVQSSSCRLARAASERPSFSGSDRTLLPSPTKSEETSGRQSLQLSRRRLSPLLKDSPLPRPSTSDSQGQESRKSALSRLATPSRHLPPSSGIRNGLRILPSPQSSPGYDGSESMSSRSPSAIGSAAANRRLNSVRPSLDTGGDRPRVYTRDRSASLTEGSPYDPPSKRPVDWLGPRTAKAFAAAGLLDGERDTAGPSVSRPGSRFGSTRSERDFRSHYAPSRAGFSDIGSSSSWGRRSGSISHTITSSEAISSGMGTPHSDSASTPRTTFSGASTAPTSISSSSVHRHLQDELSSLQEKHSLETGALLSALADSQRTTRMLREENAQLRDRLQFSEEQLAAIRGELHRAQFALSFNPPSTSTLGRSSLHRLAGQAVTEPTRRDYSSSRLQTLLHSSADDLRMEKTESRPDIPQQDPIPPRPPLDSASHSSSQRRRYSASSSIFPAPPSNMTMLLHDDGVAPDTAAGYSTAASSSPPPSPTLVLGKPLPGTTHQSSHAAHYSLSSAGNISPTTANFSMMTGSPGSLRLQPEHERLLGDMPTLDLCADDYVHDESQHGL